MSQDVFNKIVTSCLLVYTMILYTVSWILNKPIDLNGFFVLIAPLITHTMHLISNKTSDKAGSNGTH